MKQANHLLADEKNEPAMANPEEAALIRRAQRGDHEAYVALIECHGKLIYRLLLGLTNSTHAAEDLAQDVFLKMWVHLKSFKPGTCFRGWLVRIARNEFLNSRRKKCATIGRDGLMKAQAARDPGPDAALMAQETQSMLEAAVASLPEISRAALHLRIRQDLPYRDIGRALSLTTVSARWHVFHARRLLRQRLRSVVSPDP